MKEQPMTGHPGITVHQVATLRSPRENQGIGGWAVTRALTKADHPALIHDGVTVTYRQLLARATAVAHELAARGVGRGDRVAYAGRNHPAFVYTMLGAHLLGAVSVPVNFRLAPRELDFILEHSGASALVFAPEAAAAVRSSGHAGELVRSGKVAALADPTGEECHFDEWCSGSSGYLDLPVERHDVAFILYTSGTTGRPKGVVLTHDNVYWNCLNLLATLDITSREVALVSSPLFHVAALTQTLLPTLLKGATSVLMAEWDTDRCFDLIEAHGVTWIFGVPTMYAGMARSSRWDDADISSIEVLTAAGAPIPPSLIAIFQERGLVFCQGYGLTETGPGATFLEADMSRTKTGSAGVPLPFTQVRCVRPDLSDAGPGERGELIIRGPNVTPGYWTDVDATAASTVDDGWFRSGDIATVDEDGYIYIVDRVKDMYISGGENVYPAEVEAALHEHAAVQIVAVVGVPDEKWGEVGKAYVVLAPGATATGPELRAFLVGRLATYKIPVYYEFADELPRTGSGKVRKDVLRARAGAR
jgi:fatty-acyl-CoA synthase